MSWFSEEYKRFEKKVKTNVSGISAEIENIKKIDLGSPNYNQIKFNTDQDLSPFVKGAVVLGSTAVGAAGGVFIGSPLAGAVVGAELGQNLNQNVFGSRYDPSKDGGAIQKAVIGTTSDIQREAVNIGKGVQNATIVNMSDLQERAVDFADRNNLGKNETLEKWAREITHTTEKGAAEATKWWETNASGITSETEKAAEQLTTFGENAADAVSDIYDLLTGNTPDEEPLDSITSDYGSDGDLDPLDNSSMDDPFKTIEDGTAKDDQMTEEEKMRRIRRLLLNRYGREDTILTGTADTANRRTYAL